MRLIDADKLCEDLFNRWSMADSRKEGNEVHIEFEPDRTTIEVMPWKPFEYKCPYKKEEEE